MRRVAFASIEFVIDFDTEEEARKYYMNHQGKGWWFDGEPKCIDDIEGTWSITLRKPYKSYNPGW